MKKFKISNDEVAGLSNAPRYEFPKYVTQVINLVNSNAGGTRPKVVGQMSELIKEFGYVRNNEARIQCHHKRDG